jgi:hypothetical protein
MVILRHYWPDLLITAGVFGAVGVFLSPVLLLPLAILVVLEISFSFDNAVVNAKILERMSPFWQRIFLTVGIAIAVVGMRLLFPIVIVAVAAKMGFSEVVSLALHDPHTYAEKLGEAHHLIAMFGGTYLLLIFLDFVIDEEKDLHWLRKLEGPLARAGKVDNLTYVVTGGFILTAASTFGSEHALDIMMAGFTAMVLYLGVNALSSLFADPEDSSKTVVHGAAAFSLFVYLEVQDSAFSFDGVTGAFAVTDVVLVIAAGLGIGSLFVRSMTVHLVKEGTLSEYRFLEHGAHWAIGALAACMLIGVAGPEIPDYFTGLIGVVFIAFAVVHSMVLNRREATANLAVPSTGEVQTALV